jgi:hypothetical protein
VLERAAREDRSTPAPLWAKSAASTAPWIALAQAKSHAGPIGDIDRRPVVGLRAAMPSATAATPVA